VVELIKIVYYVKMGDIFMKNSAWFNALVKFLILLIIFKMVFGKIIYTIIVTLAILSVIHVQGVNLINAIVVTVLDI